MFCTIRDDDFLFVEHTSNISGNMKMTSEDNIHSKMSKSAREFLKKKFGSIARFYSGISTVESNSVNGFSRIRELRKALLALDRGGWERSYHQKIFHVSNNDLCALLVYSICCVTCF